MRLTTRLMQIASWLLVQRAVREGDMEAVEACDDKYRLSALAKPTQIPIPDSLPHGLLGLLDRANRLYERIAHMDKRMFLDATSESSEPNPVLSQMELLRNVFGGH